MEGSSSLKKPKLEEPPFLLTKNTLTLVYSHLADPTDMRCFMLVSRLFHQAGVEYPGYEAKIRKILEAFGLKRLPIVDTSFRLDQTFFALCFISCKTDEELSTKTIQHLKFGPFYGELCVFLTTLCSSVPRAQNKLSYYFRNNNGVIIYTWIGPGSVRNTSTVLYNDCFHIPGTYYEILPVALMRRRIAQVFQ